MKNNTLSLNPQITAWLDAGAMREALLGEGVFFIADHTYRSEHAIMLVMYVVLNWSKQRDAHLKTRAEINQLCQELAETGRFVLLRDILLAYDISSKDQNITLGLDVDRWYLSLPKELKWGRA